MAQIQIRIDDKTKNEAKKVLEELGLDMTTAIKLYLKQVVKQEGIPFEIYTKNGFTLKQEMEVLKVMQESEKAENLVGSMEADEFIEYLNDLE